MRPDAVPRCETSAPVLLGLSLTTEPLCYLKTQDMGGPRNLPSLPISGNLTGKSLHTAFPPRPRVFTAGSPPATTGGHAPCGCSCACPLPLPASRLHCAHDEGSHTTRNVLSVTAAATCPCAAQGADEPCSSHRDRESRWVLAAWPAHVAQQEGIRAR